MKKMYDNTPEPDYAILVGVSTDGKNIADTDLDELAALCETCNIKAVGRVLQNRKDVDVTWYIGKGKVDEVAHIVNSVGANVVVFDVELSGSKVRNLEEAFGVPVLDRSKVILDIFAMRAASMEGKLQVELAQLKYNLPRLIGSGGLMSKMRNSVGMRGPGEKKLELDKRTIRNQILDLETRIKKLAANRDLNKKSAVASGVKRVCIVGYTNSGKSTLLNVISKAGVAAEDKLFATLDPKTVKVFLNPTSRILLTDTVGFINKLPHEFIKAFESTLDETKTADLLLHVIDVANCNYTGQIDVVNTVLKQIGASNIPTILVFNKQDRVTASESATIDKLYPDVPKVHISALKNQNIENLKQLIIEVLDL